MAGPGGKAVHFVVNTDRAESDLKQLTAQELDEVAEGMKAKLVSSLKEYRMMDKKRREGQAIWEIFFGLVIFILFFELWLERRMARRRKSV